MKGKTVCDLKVNMDINKMNKNKKKVKEIKYYDYFIFGCRKSDFPFY